MAFHPSDPANSNPANLNSDATPAESDGAQRSSRPTHRSTRGRVQGVRRVRRRQLRLERLTDRRVLAAITGAVFEDTNHSLGLDDSEQGAAARLVYIDSNNNASLDPGERYALADDAGQFALTDLDDGTYQVRLFNGTSSQLQTVPVEPGGIGAVYEITDVNQNGPSDLVLTDSALQLTTSTSVVLINDRDFQAAGSSVRIADSLAKVQSLPDGSLLAIGSDASGSTAWLLDASREVLTPVDLSAGADPATAWSDIAIDGQGHGLLIQQDHDDNGTVPLRWIDATNPDDGVLVGITTNLVPSDTTAIASATGVRSVLAWSSPGGMELSLWSNSTASFISEFPVQIDDAASLLSFDDQSGLLAVRTIGGGVNIVDANNGFTLLHTFADQTGPIAIDGHRDLMFAYSNDDPTLTVVDLSDGSILAQGSIDVASVGTPAAIAVGRDPGAVIIQGSAGVGQIRLDQPLARQVVISGGLDVTDVVFGVAVTGVNAPPRYDAIPNLGTLEDTPLNLAAPGVVDGAVDSESDRFVVLAHLSSALPGSTLADLPTTANGTLVVQSDGSMVYQPDQDFAGTDSFAVLLHDGRDLSEAFHLEIEVSPLPDSPTEIRITINPVPENLEPGLPIGVVEVIDADGPGHVIEVDDPRIIVQAGEIIFVGGDLDFETEPFIPITLTVSDSQAGSTIQEVATVSLRDANDPITGIVPDTASVFENAIGDVVAELRVLDQDVEQFHTFEVDDDRFIIQESDLRLAPGVSLDYETEPEVIVNVTASEADGDNSFTQAITITVRDRAEPVAGLQLDNTTVMEQVAGAEVGTVSLGGSAVDSRYNLLVDDLRFEFVGETLQLRSDQFVHRDDAFEIELQITAVDTFGELDDVSETFTIQVLENETPAHNQDAPFDVDHSNEVTAFDALLIINYLNQFGPGPVDNGDFGYSYDVNGDGLVSALDALLVINHINVTLNQGGTVGGEGNEAESLPEGEQSQSDPPAPVIPQTPFRQQFRGLRVVVDDSDNNLTAQDASPNPRDQQFAQLANPSAATGGRVASAADAGSSAAVPKSKADELEETIGLLSQRSEADPGSSPSDLA